MQTKEIKQKMHSVKNVKKITKTMEMVSVAKMKRAVSQATASKEFANEARNLIAKTSKETTESHELLELGAGNKDLIIIIASNKGLCGAYNANISKQVQSYLSDGTKADALVIGKKAEQIAKRLGLDIVASFPDLGERITIDEAEQVALLAKKEFTSGKYQSIQFTYTEFIKAMNYRPKVAQFMPIPKNLVFTDTDEAQKNTPHAVTIFEPDQVAILDRVLPNLLTTIAYQYFLESQAAEHSSRMVAMKGASENAGNLLDDLKLSYNKARQEAITREISEIAAGGAATQSA